MTKRRAQSTQREQREEADRHVITSDNGLREIRDPEGVFPSRERCLAVSTRENSQKILKGKTGLQLRLYALRVYVATDYNSLQRANRKAASTPPVVKTTR